MPNTPDTLSSTVSYAARDVAEAALYVPAKPFLETGLGVELPSSLRVLGEATYRAATLPLALAATAMLRGIKF